MFNKPLLLNLSKDVKTVSVKEKEKVYRVDIGGTWLYEFTMIDVDETAAPIKVFARVRYNNMDKESYEDFIAKMPFISETDSGYEINLDNLIRDTASVHIKTKDSIIGEKSYFVHIDIKDMEIGTAELYIAFCSYSSNKECQKISKKLTKKIKKILK